MNMHIVCSILGDSKRDWKFNLQETLRWM